MANVSCYALLLLLAGYDLLSRGKVHRATLGGGAFSVLSKYPIAFLLYVHVPGHRLALYMQTIGRHLY